jgi:DNA-binding GntR family transcriptional regulator
MVGTEQQMERIEFSDVFAPVDHLSPIPLNLQIVTQIESALHRDKLEKGVLLPSEADLCAGFGAARSTVRRALKTLESRGMVTRERGRSGGTRIEGSGPLTRTPGAFTTLYELIAGTQRKPRTRVHSARSERVTDEMSDLMGFPVGTQVMHITRFRSANEVPVAVLENWIRPAYITFALERLESESLEALFRESGVKISHVEFEYVAVRAGKTAEFFEIDPSDPVLNEIRHVFDEQHQYEYSHHYTHPENERVRGVATP